MSISHDEGHRLSRMYGGIWGEYPTHSREDWQYEVVNGDTVLGYWEWVAIKLYDDPIPGEDT